MKRNKLMGAASVLLALTMLSTSTFSGVLAKYVVSDNVSDAARVAKFGVVLTAAGDLFGSSYAPVASGNTIVSWTANNAATGTVNACDSGTTKLIAPGTKNDTGMKFTVKGTPEVKTSLLVDVAENASGADYANTDVKLYDGNYSVMVKIDVDDAGVTKNNFANFYKFDDTSSTFAQLLVGDVDAVASGDITEVYKKVELTRKSDDAALVSNKMAATGYLPITWKVDNVAVGTGALSTYTPDAAGVLNALKYKLSGAASGAATHEANVPWNATATVTWEWAYGNAWEDVANGDIIANWENTSLTDLEDTALGMMMSLVGTDNDDTNDYLVASGANLVKYAQVPAAASSANNVWVAYTGASEPASAAAANAACLEATLGARLTVSQVD